jgi:hypothetical protein
MLLQEKSFNDY